MSRGSVAYKCVVRAGMSACHLPFAAAFGHVDPLWLNVSVIEGRLQAGRSGSGPACCRIPAPIVPHSARNPGDCRHPANHPLQPVTNGGLHNVSFKARITRFERRKHAQIGLE